MVRKRPLTPEEKLLWQQVTKSVKRLGTEDNSLPPCGGGQGRGVTQVINQLLLTPTLPRKGGGSKKMGDYAGIDKNTAQRFKKGENIIDAKLDLHGMTSEKAHKALISFINKQVKAEKRRLLVITGKGNGILRSALPGWLSTPNVSGHILAFDTAQAKHGGGGAYYILLKRKRTHNDQR